MGIMTEWQADMLRKYGNVRTHALHWSHTPPARAYFLQCCAIVACGEAVSQAAAACAHVASSVAALPTLCARWGSDANSTHTHTHTRAPCMPVYAARAMLGWGADTYACAHRGGDGCFARVQRRALLMDATSSTNKWKYSLTTLLVITDAGFGIPVAWVIHSNDEADTLQRALDALAAKMGEQFQPSVMIIDNAAAEIKAIEACAW